MIARRSPRAKSLKSLAPTLLLAVGATSPTRAADAVAVHVLFDGVHWKFAEQMHDVGESEPRLLATVEQSKSQVFV